MKWEAISGKDKQIIAEQIRRAPRNLHGIARRCQGQSPQVIVNYPLSQAKADACFFPTVFWLTCPEAVRSINRIEAKGYIRRIQAEIKKNQALTQEMQDAHQEYIYIRYTLLNRQSLDRIREPGEKLAKELKQVGIGGVADLQGIKCLHTHYAHFLATRNNPVGRLVDKMINFNNRAWQCNTCTEQTSYAGVAELADAADLKSVEP